MTLWSDFLRRLMLGASLSTPAVAIGADDAVGAQPPAEVGEQQPDRPVDHDATEAEPPPAPAR